MGGAELYPLEGELGVRPEQGHKIGRKGGAAALALGADYLVGGDVDDAEVDDAGDHGVVEYLVKDLEIGVAPGEDALAVCLLPGLEGQGILDSGFRLTHIGASFKIVVCRTLTL